MDTGDRETPASEETTNQRLTRNVNELLGELRVVQAGVQILFGFLLTVVFTDRFQTASGWEKSLHVTTVLFAVSSTALFAAPAALHRTLFRQDRRADILRVSNILVLAGLLCVAMARTLTVALIAEVVFGFAAMLIVGFFCILLFGLLWFVIPARLSRKKRSVVKLPS